MGNSPRQRNMFVASGKAPVLLIWFSSATTREASRGYCLEAECPGGFCCLRVRQRNPAGRVLSLEVQRKRLEARQLPRANCAAELETTASFEEHRGTCASSRCPASVGSACGASYAKAGYGLAHGRDIVEHRREPALGLRHRPCPCGGVVLDLVALDLADAEIVALRVAEIEPAHRGARPHREALGELHADRALGVEQAEQGRLLGVIGLRRIARRRADAAILLGDQVGLVRSFSSAA